MKDKVSIIIPFYRSLKYLSQTIKSVQKQTYKNYEIILIYDDEDKSDLKVIKNKFKNLKKLIIIENKKNLGAAKSRNIGISKSKGKYIAFLDADDYWKKDKLQKQISFMKQNSLDLSYSSYEIISGNFKSKQDVKKTYTYDELLQKCDIGLSTVIMKSKLSNISAFPTLKTQEDYALWLKFVRKGVKFMGINTSLVYWRDTPESLSKNVIQKLKDSFKVYYVLENKNLLESMFRVFVLSKNKLKKIYRIKN